MRVVWVLVLAAALGCAAGNDDDDPAAGSSSGGTVPDAGMPDAASAADAALPTRMEQEPNNGAAASEVNPLSLPGAATGAINPADDIDIFAVQLAAGTLWTWELVAAATALAPHFSMSQDGNRVPVLVAAAGAGQTARQEQFVLEDATYYAIVRDARNVPAEGSSSQHVGSAQHAYQLSARPLERTPMPATFPSVVTGALRTGTSLDLYSFTLAPAQAFDIVVRARRMSPPSDLDTRISLYDATHRDYIMTNDDDAAESTLDSHVGGTVAQSGSYVLVVENVAVNPTNRAYELHFSLR